VYLSIIVRRNKSAVGQKLEEVNKRLGCTQKVEVSFTVEGTCLAQTKLIYFFFHFFFIFQLLFDR